MRLTWIQPEDLLPHALVQAQAEHVDVTRITQRWVQAGGTLTPSVSGASTEPARPAVRALAGQLLDEIDAATALHGGAADGQPANGQAVFAGERQAFGDRRPRSMDLDDRLLGAWLGRAAGCLLGKPVEKIPRAGVRDIARATDNWPVRRYFTATGLPADVAAQWPWNRRSAPTSLQENIDGMPEDDDLNYTMLALELLERHGPRPTTDQVATAWLDELPAGRVFTAERVVYANLLHGVDPSVAAQVRNPFREWIGALIRADLYGWANPGRPDAAARAVHGDAWLSHRRNGLYGAMWAAGMAATALVATTVTEVIDAGLRVVPADSELAFAVHFGVDLAKSTDDSERALDELARRYGHLHWVHVLNNAALIAYALTASDGDFDTAIGLAVTGGWDTDSDAATVGGICGALHGSAGIADEWTAPLHDRVATSLPGMDGMRLSALAARTRALVDTHEVAPC